MHVKQSASMVLMTLDWKNESNNSANLRCEIGKKVKGFLYTCETSSATAEAIYTALDEKISLLLDTCEPWHNSTSVGVDSARQTLAYETH